MKNEGGAVVIGTYSRLGPKAPVKASRWITRSFLLFFKILANVEHKVFSGHFSILSYNKCKYLWLYRLVKNFLEVTVGLCLSHWRHDFVSLWSHCFEGSWQRQTTHTHVDLVKCWIKFFVIHATIIIMFVVIITIFYMSNHSKLKKMPIQNWKNGNILKRLFLNWFSSHLRCGGNRDMENYIMLTRQHHVLT